MTTPTLDEAELDRLERLYAAATPGEWEADGEPHNVIVWSAPEMRVCFMTSDGEAQANADFIVAAHESFPALIAAARSLPSERRAREEAERERDARWKAAVEVTREMAEQVRVAEAALAAERARVVDLEEALEPFAAFAEWVAVDRPGWDHDGFALVYGASLEKPLLLAPFRRAAAIRARTTGESNETSE